MMQKTLGTTKTLGTKKSRTSVRITGGALAVVIAAMLTGCFANPLDAIVENVTEETAQNTAEEIIEGVTGGETDVNFGELPDDFPTEVPLVSQNVLQSVVVAEGMMVIVSDSRSMKELAAQVKGDFAGWEQIAWSDMGEMVSAMYKKDDSLSVGVGIIGDDDEGNRVSYTIIRSEG